MKYLALCKYVCACIFMCFEMCVLAALPFYNLSTDYSYIYIYVKNHISPLACYIDIDEPEDEELAENDSNYSQWHTLPDILLEEIFSYLTYRERYYASLVSIIQ